MCVSKFIALRQSPDRVWLSNGRVERQGLLGGDRRARPRSRSDELGSTQCLPLALCTQPLQVNKRQRIVSDFFLFLALDTV